MRFSWSLLLVLIHVLPAYAGGPWVTPKRSGFVQAQSTFPLGTYNELFLADGSDLLLNREVLDVNFGIYAEYGLTDKIDLITNIPFKYIKTGAVQDSLTNPNLMDAGSLFGMSNYRFGIKYGILDKKLKGALSLQTSWNTTRSDFSKGLTTGYGTNAIALFGHLGGSITPKLYSFVEGGYNVTTNSFSHYIDAHFEIGYNVSSPLWAVFTLDLRESMENGSYYNENLIQTGFYPNNQEYFAFGLKGNYELPSKIGFNLATFGAFSGNYVAHVLTFSVGVYKKW